MDLATLKEQAERYRRLAKHADPFTQKKLLDLASAYEAQIAKLEPEPSAASRVLRMTAAFVGFDRRVRPPKPKQTKTGHELRCGGFYRPCRVF